MFRINEVLYLSSPAIESISSKITMIGLFGSINRIESTLRSFFKHLQQEHGLEDPTLEIAPSKSARRLPKALTIDQILSMIDAAYRESDPVTLRDQAMLELLYSSGARVSELIGINLNDLSIVQSDDGEITTLKLRGKGSKERIVPLGSFASKAIDDYCVRVRPSLLAKNPKGNTALFLNSRGGRISRQSRDFQRAPLPLLKHNSLGPLTLLFHLPNKSNLLDNKSPKTQQDPLG